MREDAWRAEGPQRDGVIGVVPQDPGLVVQPDGEPGSRPVGKGAILRLCERAGRGDGPEAYLAGGVRPEQPRLVVRAHAHLNRPPARVGTVVVLSDRPGCRNSPQRDPTVIVAPQDA